MNIIRPIGEVPASCFKKNADERKGEAIKVSTVDVMLAQESLKASQAGDGVSIEFTEGGPCARITFKTEDLATITTIRNDVVRWAAEKGVKPDQFPQDEDAWLSKGRAIWASRSQNLDKLKTYQKEGSWEDFLDPIVLFEYICRQHQQIDKKDDFATVIAAFNKMTHFYSTQCSTAAYAECEHLDEHIHFMIKRLAKGAKCYYSSCK